MSKVVQFSVLILFIFMTGCSSVSKYEDNEAAAIVKGQKIIIGDLRFLYPDDTALDYLDWAIRIELVKQKVKEMDLDISDKLSEERDDGWFGELPPTNTKDEGGKQIRKFAESQAQKLDMKPEEFQREYAKKIDEQNAYLVTYIEKKLGVAEFDEEKRMEEFNKEADHLLEELVEDNEDEIEVLID
ncbi:hypothetical protein SAMN05216232_0169 [Virgibacillus subterraneus]|uniref:Uncharacterized protein n=1 Tax=Virgibacillus subterraneus TaxID=621109 RepID=A0A1H9L791_9BACI|nr:hypothetical protein [Virgibacillus subterraneus]SER07099.1 hypothetical protein SAMN05216232_0169 [Virgibacillus subterraneus]